MCLHHTSRTNSRRARSGPLFDWRGQPLSSTGERDCRCPLPTVSLALPEEYMGQLVRNKSGQFVEGHTGQGGRPKGSKNVITLQKLALEEAFRGDLRESMSEVLAMVVQQALGGDKASQKLVWDANVSKQAISDEKSAGAKQQITVKTMNVHKGAVIEGEFTSDEDNEEKP